MANGLLEGLMSVTGAVVDELVTGVRYDGIHEGPDTSAVKHAVVKSGHVNK